MNLFPDRVVIEPTAQCNLSCAMCPRRFLQLPDGMMSLRRWKLLIDELLEWNPKAIVLPFWRGEPLMNPYLHDMLRYAVDRGVGIHLSTNGHLMSRSLANIMAELEFVSFSIHDDICAKRAQDFLAFKGAARVVVQASFVENEITVGRYMRKYLADPLLGGFDAIRLFREHSRQGVFGHCSGTGRRHLCPKLKDTMVVSVNGYVSRCNHLWCVNERLNVFERSMISCWEASDHIVTIEDYPDKLCQECDQWNGHTQGERWSKFEKGVKYEIF